MTATPVDLDSARQFIDFMAEGEPVTFQTFDDSAAGKHSSLARVLHGGIDERAEELMRLNAQGAGVYWMVNYGDGEGRTAANVQGVRALFVDLDGEPLAPVLEATAQPHVIIESSPRKWHVYWLVTGCELAGFKGLQQALARHFGGDPSVCDLPRVLRVPGFWHRKAKPFMVRIERLDAFQPYPVDELVRRLGLQPVSNEQPRPPRTQGAKVAEGGRHAHLRTRLADLNWRGIPQAGIRAALHAINEVECDPPQDRAEVDALVTDWARRYGAQHGRDRSRAEDERVDHELPPRPPWSVVPIADLADAELPSLAWAWEGYIPCGEVTLLSAHGGTGKSFLALMMGVCVALGLPLLGIATTKRPVIFYSAEDARDTLRRRLQWVCRAMGIDAAALQGRLTVLDATATDPALYRPRRVTERDPTVIDTSTAASRALIELVNDTPGGPLVIVDNASDVFDGKEIERAQVRAFMRDLARVARVSAGAVVLLAHVDKNTAKGLGSGESYSGSTAWHNSARSRLSLKRDKDDALLLEHEKSNHGATRQSLRLMWPEGGLPTLDVPVNGFVQAIAERTNTKAVLKLLHEFSERGEWVSTATTSRTHAGKLLRGQRGFPPRLPDAELFDLLRQAHRRGLIEPEMARSKGRGHEKEVWKLTPAGITAADIAPTAPTAPTSGVGADAEGAPTAPTSARGVWGEVAGARVGADPHPPPTIDPRRATGRRSLPPSVETAQ